MTDMSKVVVFASTGVEYDIEDAKVSIDDLIASLEEAKANGAEYVVQDSGNYHGAQWQAVTDSWDWAEDVIGS